MITFGSRGSELARTQTGLVAEALRARTGVDYRIEIIETRGDVILDRPLPEIGGKGLFTAELEEALRSGRIDAAVHSLKDLPVEDPEGLVVAAIPARVDPSDVLVCAPAAFDGTASVVPLRAGSRVGTSSHRRRAALAALRPDLDFRDVRGNVPTRVAKVRRGEFDAVVLAAAGIDRLGLDLHGLIRTALQVGPCPPAPAQGALGVQCRKDDARMREMLGNLHDAATARCVLAERELLARLGGGCSMPLGALATEADGGVRLRAALFAEPGLHAAPAPGVFLDLQGPDLAPLVAAAAAQWQALVGAPLRGQAVAIFRPDGDGGELAAGLAVAGARVRSVALTRVVPLAVDAAATADLLPGRALAFTSQRAVARFGALMGAAGFHGVPAFAAGPTTAAALQEHGVACVTPADSCGGAALARCVIATGVPARGVLFPCADGRQPDFERELAAAAVPVVPLPLYRVEPLPEATFTAAPGETLVFTSPSAVRAYTAVAPSAATRCVAIGPTTAAAMAAAGLTCDAVAVRPDAAALVLALRSLHHA